MADRILAGIEIYNHSSQEFGLMLAEYDFPLPQVREIHETVPHRNGIVDFTFMNGGKPSFDPYVITFKFLGINNNWKTRGDLINDITAWLYAKPFGKMTTDIHDDFEFDAKCTGIKYSIKSYGVEFDVEMLAQPYKRKLSTNERMI